MGATTFCTNHEEWCPLPCSGCEHDCPEGFKRELHDGEMVTADGRAMGEGR
ncbi:hypothetical protein EDD28_0050 [Salana multivorans]|uniref:Uncharacterized protein n=1 Tax=Salana multivorans TaxID=120377 RepID=A0A3N2D6U2_9MICO|nr:hypothetical protein EDD28_0050 [Salana multivorans]